MPTPGLHSDEARQAVAMIYLNQAGDEVPFPGGKDMADIPGHRRGGEYARRRNLARDEWLKQRKADGIGGEGEPSPAYMFHIGSGFVKLTVAVFTNEHESRAEYECLDIMEEWIREHRPDELNEEGELDEVYCEIIPAEVEPPDPSG